MLTRLFPSAETLRCRLDRASSPPRALKLVAAAAAEVREALAGLADSLDGDSCGDEYTSSERGTRQNDEGGRGGRGKDTDGNASEEAAAMRQSCAASMLVDIMRNCRILLKCTAQLPLIELAR